MMSTIETVTSLKDYEYVWIYNWDVTEEKFYCIPYERGQARDVVKNAIAVQLSASFAETYNHLLVITKSLESFNHRFDTTLNFDAFGISKIVNFNKNDFNKNDKPVGHLIMNQLTPEEIMNKENQGIPLLIFCRKAKELYTLLKSNYYFYHIDAMANYRDTISCFFNLRRILTRFRNHLPEGEKEFNSRGLFRVTSNNDKNCYAVEKTLRYVSENSLEYFNPSYRITSFDIEAARFDKHFPGGGTKLDRVCTVAFQTKLVVAEEKTLPSPPSGIVSHIPEAPTPKLTDYDRCYTSDYDRCYTDVLAYVPDRTIWPEILKRVQKANSKFNLYLYQTERSLLTNVIRYMERPDSIYLTGWNIIHFDYPFLANRLLYHGLIPHYIGDKSLRRMYGQNKSSQVFDLAPPWKLSIDSMECRKRYFPRTLPVNPPSNAIDETARTLLLSNAEEKREQDEKREEKDEKQGDEEGGGGDGGGEGGGEREGKGKLAIDIMEIHEIYKQMEEERNEMERKETHPEEEEKHPLLYERANPEETIKQARIDYLTRLVTYNVRDVELVSQLNEKLQVIKTLVPLSQMADLNPGDCVHYNTTRVGVTYMRNHFESLIFAPIDENFEIWRRQHTDCGLLPAIEGNNSYAEMDGSCDRGKKGTYKGATVFDPAVGVFTRVPQTILGCLDFASLYPSIMRTYNVMRGYVSRIKLSAYAEKKETYDRHFHCLIQEDYAYLSLKSIDGTAAPIADLCTELIRKRKLNKTKAPTIANALKIIVNSLYGICGLAGTLLYDEAVATMITGFGRHHLTSLKKYFERRYESRVLYGDTDSIFLCCDTPEHLRNSHSPFEALKAMADEYNATQLPATMQLSAECTFDCILFVRKKLYLAKMSADCGGGYKVSGFPQRLELQTHALMTRTIHAILDTLSANRHPQNQSRLVGEICMELFENITRDDCGAEAKNIHNNREERDVIKIKVRPLEEYKSEQSRNYYVGMLYERETGKKITGSYIYIPVYDIIPIVRQLPGKRFSTCLIQNYDERVHIINKSASITEFFSKTFDPILDAVRKNVSDDDNDDNDDDNEDDDDDDSNSPTNSNSPANSNSPTNSNLDEKNQFLKRMSERYKSSLLNKSLIKYQKCGFNIRVMGDISNFSNRDKINWLPIDFDYLWDKYPFYSTTQHGEIFDNFINKSSANSNKNILRNVVLNINVYPSYAVLADDNTSLKLISKKKFACLDELGKNIRALVKNKELISRIKIRVKNITDFSQFQSFLTLFGFIYDEKEKEKETLQTEETAIEETDPIAEAKNHLLILPFIAIKMDQNGVSFTFF